MFKIEKRPSFCHTETNSVSHTIRNINKNFHVKNSENKNYKSNDYKKGYIKKASYILISVL